MEQLAEMTRLLFKLSEVKNIFSKAQIEDFPSPEDPKEALIRFLEVFFISIIFQIINYNFFQKILKCY